MKPESSERMRLDKWLWAARFYKTRGLATDEINKGRVQVNGQAAKPARELKLGDTVDLRQGTVQRTVRVLGLSPVRGPAPLAQALYAETTKSHASYVSISAQIVSSWDRWISPRANAIYSGMT
jgi:ribosome-associated heat shock protein Hsp15